jgi:hypothetical protein
MRTLTSEAFEASKKFIATTARALERALFHYEYLNGPKEAVLNALREYQNEDGGFGNALEPDLRTPESSVICTSIAFQTLRSLDVPADHDLVVCGINYLVSKFEEGQCGWRIIPASAENYPRAPWWYQAGHEAQFSRFSLNPTAEILGYLEDNRHQVSQDLITMVWDRIFDELDNTTELEMHELLCCLRLYKTANLPTNCRARLHDHLRRFIATTVATDPKQWRGYSLRPLQVIDSPESPFMAELSDSVAANLDYEIASANVDGSWTPTWSWDDAYPDVWSMAKQEWSGVITLEKLLILKRFGRIGGAA